MGVQSDVFWKDYAKGFLWSRNFQTVSSGGFKEGNVRWFEDGELNLCENLLDRHIKSGHGDQVAFYWEPNEATSPSNQFTYSETLEEVNKFANALKQLGVKRGDVVGIYMPMIPEAVFATLACSRIGAVHTIVFGGFSKEALEARLNDSKARVLVTAQKSYRGSKSIDLLEVALSAAHKTAVERVVCTKNSDEAVEQNSLVVDYDSFVSGQSPECEPELVGAEDPLFILYTSGSTGKPKGLVHTTAGYMIWSAYTFREVFDPSENDVFWCTADLGWITGHSYFLYGPFLNGVTQVMFEGVPTHPDPGRFWDIVEKYKVSHFYTAPTAIRALQSCGDEYVERSNLESLKVLGTVGEPINREAWDWYNSVVGGSRCEIVDTWWQTETGGIMISNLPGKNKAKPTYATQPLGGVTPVLLDASSKLLTENDVEGVLCLAEPWPGMARTILNDHQRYLATYMEPYPGYYYTGDGARRDFESDYRIIGRVDDVVNVSGHRIGTAEIEDIINKSGVVVESAVIGVPDQVTGEALLAFGILQGDDANRKNDLEVLNDEIKKKVGSFSKLKAFIPVSDLPKTRSGKIMRRLLRKIATDDSNFGDTSTLLNPGCLDEIRSRILEKNP